MTDTKRADTFAVPLSALHNATVTTWQRNPSVKLVPSTEWQASPQSRAASQQYLNSKRRPSVAPWVFGGVAAGMALYAALDAFLRGGL